MHNLDREVQIGGLLQKRDNCALVMYFKWSMNMRAPALVSVLNKLKMKNSCCKLCSTFAMTLRETTV
jgi:hypothetical protein